MSNKQLFILKPAKSISVRTRQAAVDKGEW